MCRRSGTVHATFRMKVRKHRYLYDQFVIQHASPIRRGEIVNPWAVSSWWAQGPTGCCGRVAVADDRASAGVIIRRVRTKHAGTAQDFSEPPAAARQRATTYPPVLGARTCTTTNPVRRHGRRGMGARSRDFLRVRAVDAAAPVTGASY
jgi:hypothetical protein